MKKHYTLFFSLLLSLSVKATIFTNSNAITIVDNDKASTYPSQLAVSGMSGLVSNVQVTIHGLSHVYVSDVSLLLQAPSGEALLLQSFCADGASATNLTYTIADAGATQFSAASIWSNNGTYKPTSYMWDIFPSPAPLTPPGFGSYNAPGPFGPQTATFASTFNGINPNGTWKLFIGDFASGDAGTISGGWSLNISSGGFPLTMAQIQLSASQKNQEAYLNWNTQENFYQNFMLEESEDGFHFFTISSTTNFASTTAITDAGTRFYRIKGLTVDGNFAYSNIVSIVSKENTMPIEVFPSTTQHAVFVRNTELKDTKIAVYSLTGSALYSLTSSSEMVEIPLHSFVYTPGYYVVRIQQDETTKTYKILYQP